MTAPNDRAVSAAIERAVIARWLWQRRKHISRLLGDHLEAIAYAPGKPG